MSRQCRNRKSGGINMDTETARQLVEVLEAINTQLAALWCIWGAVTAIAIALIFKH